MGRCVRSGREDCKGQNGYGRESRLKAHETSLMLSAAPVKRPMTSRSSGGIRLYDGGEPLIGLGQLAQKLGSGNCAAEEPSLRQQGPSRVGKIVGLLARLDAFYNHL